MAERLCSLLCSKIMYLYGCGYSHWGASTKSLRIDSFNGGNRQLLESVDVVGVTASKDPMH